MIFSLVEVRQEEIDSEGELYIRRRERVAALVRSEGVEDVEQRMDNAEVDAGTAQSPRRSRGNETQRGQ